MTDSLAVKLNLSISENDLNLLFTNRSDIFKGEKFSENNIKSIRPSGGLNPKLFFKILKRKSKKNIKLGSPINKSHF